MRLLLPLPVGKKKNESKVRTVVVRRANHGVRLTGTSLAICKYCRIESLNNRCDIRLNILEDLPLCNLGTIFIEQHVRARNRDYGMKFVHTLSKVKVLNCAVRDEFYMMGHTSLTGSNVTFSARGVCALRGVVGRVGVYN